MVAGKLTRLRGICWRVSSPGGLGPDVVMPGKVRATINFDLDHVIGMATLSRDEHGNIWAEVPGVDVDQRLFGLCPYFSISAAAKPGVPAVIKDIAISESNIDPDLPRYEVFLE